MAACEVWIADPQEPTGRRQCGEPAVIVTRGGGSEQPVIVCSRHGHMLPVSVAGYSDPASYVEVPGQVVLTLVG